MAIILQVVYSIYFVGNKSFTTSKDIGFAQQEIRNVSIALSKELKAAKQINNTSFSADSQIKEIFIISTLIDGVTACYIEVGNQTFGPFIPTEFFVSTSDKRLYIELVDINYTNIREEISIYFESWNRFTYTDLFSDEFGMPINFNSIYYTKYD